MKYNKILAVGVTGALLFSITGSVKPLNIAMLPKRLKQIRQTLWTLKICKTEFIV